MTVRAIRLPALAELERETDRVKLEAERLLMHARELLMRVEVAKGEPNEFAVLWTAQYELAALMRQLTRGQCVLVHQSDDRWHAAQAVLGFLAEADERGPSVFPVQLGVDEAA